MRKRTLALIGCLICFLVGVRQLKKQIIIKLFYSKFIIFILGYSYEWYLCLLYFSWISIKLLMLILSLMDFSLLPIWCPIGLDINFTGEFFYMDSGGTNNNIDPLAGGNPSGGTPGGPGNGNNIPPLTGGESDRRERPVNAMSLTQMCNPTIEDTPTEPTPAEPTPIEPLDKESLARVYQVLSDERDAYEINNPDRKHLWVSLSDLGYNFVRKNGSVISELINLKNTDPYFEGLKGKTNVNKVIYYCAKQIKD